MKYNSAQVLLEYKINAELVDLKGRDHFDYIEKLAEHNDLSLVLLILELFYYQLLFWILNFGYQISFNHNFCYIQICKYVILILLLLLVNYLNALNIDIFIDPNNLSGPKMSIIVGCINYFCLKLNLLYFNGFFSRKS